MEFDLQLDFFRQPERQCVYCISNNVIGGKPIRISEFPQFYDIYLIAATLPRTDRGEANTGLFCEVFLRHA